MRRKNVIPISLLSIGSLLTLIGIIGFKIYFWDAVVQTFGQPDKSMVFWASPIVFLAIPFVVGGIFLIVFSLQKLRE